MNFAPVSFTPSFSARLSGQSYFERDNSTGKIIKRESSMQDMLESYDSQIRKIQKQKECAIELDTFMRSDEVKELVDKLPDDTVLEIGNNFCLDGEIENETEVPLNKGMILIYDQDAVIEHAQACNRTDLKLTDTYDMSTCCVQNEDGNINKNAIITWLNNLISFFQTGK